LFDGYLILHGETESLFTFGRIWLRKEKTKMALYPKPTAIQPSNHFFHKKFAHIRRNPIFAQELLLRQKDEIFFSSFVRFLPTFLESFRFYLFQMLMFLPFGKIDPAFVTLFPFDRKNYIDKAIGLYVISQEPFSSVYLNRFLGWPLSLLRRGAFFISQRPALP
jgi:hypothetical protein